MVQKKKKKKNRKDKVCYTGHQPRAILTYEENKKHKNFQSLRLLELGRKADAQQELGGRGCIEYIVVVVVVLYFTYFILLYFTLLTLLLPKSAYT
jgi:hypothetical protein